jgi:hypothetical protein
MVLCSYVSISGFLHFRKKWYCKLMGAQVVFFSKYVKIKNDIGHLHLRKKWYYTFVGSEVVFKIHIGEEKNDIAHLWTHKVVFCIQVFFSPLQMIF